MTRAQHKPELRPANPFFSSGPCPKYPQWNPAQLNNALLGRSHRSKAGKEKLARVIRLTRETLQIPPDYRIGITAASDTGAMEMALWSLLGERGVDVLAWESFGSDWLKDVRDHLQLADCRAITAPYGELPDLQQTDGKRDIVFVWNGTTSGVRVPDGSWIDPRRQGLTLCDATSALFAQNLPWDKLDVVTFSWQKALGGEAAHGMIVLSPRAIERLLHFTPPRPLPKIFRLAANGKLNEGFFQGETINTPSMLCVEDYLAALEWAQSLGGLPSLIARADKNLALITEWVEKTPWIDFLCADPALRSNTSVCLKLTAPQLADEESQKKCVKTMTALLEKEGAAFDIASYRAAPPGLRIWAGATVEENNLRALFPWLDWAFAQTCS